MERVAHQTTILIHIQELISSTKVNLTQGIQEFFDSMNNSDGIYKTKFQGRFDALRDLLRDLAEEKNQASDAQDGDESNRLSEDDLDPIEVINSLPLGLLECLKARDIKQLQNYLSKVSEQEARKHIHRCVKCELLRIDTNNIADEEQ